MSGGEKRRVALARILVAQARARDLRRADQPPRRRHDQLARAVPARTSFPARCSSSRTIATCSTPSRRACSISRTAASSEYTKRNDAVGAFEDFLEQKAERFAHAERVESNRQNFLRKEIEWLRRGPKARSTKQKARIQRARDRDRRRGPARSRRGRARRARDRAPRDSAGRSSSCSTCSLDLGGRTPHRRSHAAPRERRPRRHRRAERRRQDDAACASSPASSRRPREASCAELNTKFAYFDQARTTLRDDWTVFDNVAEREGADRTGAGIVTIGDETIEMRAYLELFLFEGAALRRKVSALSGGERARVALALALKTGANVLLLDEPTNDLDIATLGSLAELSRAGRVASSSSRTIASSSIAW